jgi:hypothetical protein
MTTLTNTARPSRAIQYFSQHQVSIHNNTVFTNPTPKPSHFPKPTLNPLAQPHRFPSQPQRLTLPAACPFQIPFSPHPTPHTSPLTLSISLLLQIQAQDHHAQHIQHIDLTDQRRQAKANVTGKWVPYSTHPPGFASFPTAAKRLTGICVGLEWEWLCRLPLSKPLFACPCF